MKELLSIRNAAACIRVGPRPPYRLRKEGKAAGLLDPWPWEREEASWAEAAGEDTEQAALDMKQDYS